MRERLKMGKLKTTCRKLKNAVIIAHIRTEWYSFSCNSAIIVAKYTGGLVLVLGLVFFWIHNTSKTTLPGCMECQCIVRGRESQ